MNSIALRPAKRLNQEWSEQSEAPPPTYWWAGTLTGHLRVPFLRRVHNKIRRRLFKQAPTLPPVDTTREDARRRARPTCTGFGDMLLAWLTPITVAEMMHWNLRIPVPRLSGGIHHDPSRARLNAQTLSTCLSLPAHVELVDAETIPDGCNWFHTEEADYFLNACRETSYETIPGWIRRQGISRSNYLESVTRVANRLRYHPHFRPGPLEPDQRYAALHLRRQDKGNVADQELLLGSIHALAPAFRSWIVVSDHPETRERMTYLLAQLGCNVLSEKNPDSNPAAGLFHDFYGLVHASAIVSSVAGAWSAFPYAAARVGGAPLVFSLEHSKVWTMLQAYSPEPIRGIHFGPAAARNLRRDLLHP